MNSHPLWLAQSGDQQVAVAAGLLIVKVTVLLAVAWCVHALLRSANPRWRVWLWRCSALGIVLLVGMTFSPPIVNWAVLPDAGVQKSSGETRPPAPPTGAPSSILVAESPTIVEPSPWPERTAPEYRSSPPESFRVHSPASAAPPPVPVEEAPSLLTTVAPPALSEPVPLQPQDAAVDSSGRFLIWLAAVWLAGLIGSIGWMFSGLRRLRMILNRAKPAPAYVIEAAAAVRDQLGCRREFGIRQTSELVTPCLIGVRRPTVLLPAAQCDEPQREELTAILAHETAHVVHHDLPWNTTLHGLSIVFWFHPLMWRMRGVHADACDAVADVVAADSVGDATRYGRTLARLAVRISDPSPATALAMARSSNVRRRIEALQQTLFRANLPRRRLVTLATLGLIAVTLLGSVALTQAVDDPQTAGTEPAAGESEARESAPADSGASEARLRVMATVAESGEPLPGVAVRFHGRMDGERYDRQLETNEDGMLSIAWSDGATVNNLWMTASKDTFVPIHYTWRNDRRPVELPREIQLAFEQGQVIGGIVQDEAGRPIEGAEIDVTMPIDWPKLANHVFTAAERTTDAEGRWQWDGAPEDLGRVSIRVTHPDYLRSWSEASTTLDAVAVLKQGLQVTGRVLTADGEPIEGATARLGFDRFGTGEPEGTTDEDGRFVLRNAEPGKSLVTVQAEGFSPQFREFTVGEHEDSGEFRLDPGHTMRVRVVDGNGNPVEGAIFATDTWRGYRTVAFRTTTDEQGRVEWRSAPEDAVLCDILKTGYLSVRKLPLQASDEEHVVTLPAPLVISGRVTDATTGEPLSEFEVRRGYLWRGRNDPSWSGDAGVPYENGAYEFKFDEPINGDYLLQVLAPGYLVATSRPFKPDEGSVAFNFALQPGDGLSGTVLTPTGEPAAEAQVGLATVENRAMLDNGHFDRRQNSAEVVQADADGRFGFLPQDEGPFLLIALHDAGFAEVTHEQFAESTEIRLEPWGRLDGEVRLGDGPDANREVSFHPRRPDRKGMFVFSYGYEMRTDAEGRFRFDRVIPGPGTVSRVVITEFLGSWQHAPGWQQPVEIEPRETTTVSIGGTGQRVVGKVELDREPDVVIDWTTNEPAAIGRWNVDTDQRDESYFRCLGNIDQTGRFEIADVPPGDYRLTIPVNNPPSPNSCGAGEAIGRAEYTFRVPQLPGGRSDEPLDLGVVTAELFDTLDPGELAPDFVAETLSGDRMRMSELHGKLVLLDFWATWCAPCLAEMPALAEIQREFGDDERFVLLGVSCDDQISAPRDYVAEAGLEWSHAHVSGMQSRPLRDYTVRALPATYLIGPDGRVMAKGLRGESLKQAVAAALGNDELFERAANAERPPRFPVVRFEPSDEEALPTEPALVVLDNCDENFRDEEHTDGLHLVSAEGRELGVLRAFNNCRASGGMHGVAVDSERGRIFVRELVGNRVHCFDRHGLRLWQVERIEASVLAVDPQTGNVWCSGGSSLNQGETVVLDAEGREVAAYPVRGIDMAYDSHSDAFWLAGYEILKLNRQGEVLFRRPVDGWCCASVSVNPATGDVWLIERDHPDVADSRNRLWKLDADGSVWFSRDLEDLDPFAVECDPRSGDVWVASLNSGLHRFSADGEPQGQLDLKAYNLAMSRDGLWAATEEAVLKFDDAGQITVRYEFDRPSAQAWLAVFERAER